jgi:Family of unknown function (DUF6580)
MNGSKEKSEKRALGLVITGALLRLMPHPPNVAPVDAMSLFAGARLNGWMAYLVPLLLMLITDPIVALAEGFHPFSSRTPVIYLSFMISVWIGRRLRGVTSPKWIGLAAFAAAFQFYLLTNFQSWYVGDALYPHTWAGLVACYTAALPFFGLTLLGSLGYSGLFFGIDAWLKQREGRGETDPVVE